MPTHDFNNIGEVLDFQILKGKITAIDSATDTCTVTVAGSSREALIFYHCKPDSIIRDNGAIEGGAAGFKVDDEVIVLINSDKSVIKVVGHVDGIRACEDIIYYRLYLNGVLAEYGGETIRYGFITIKEPSTNPLILGITTGGEDFAQKKDNDVIEFRLFRGRTVGNLCKEQYDGYGYDSTVTNPKEMFWGYAPYEVVITPYGESYPGFTDNRILTSRPSDVLLTPSYIIHTTTAKNIRDNSHYLKISETETIKVYDVYGTLPKYYVGKTTSWDNVHGTNVTYGKPNSSYVTGVFTDDGSNGLAQTGVYTATGKPSPEIDDNGIYIWDFSANSDWEAPSIIIGVGHVTGETTMFEIPRFI
jgi:hypothetical protein